MSGWAIEVRGPPGSRAATAARLVEWTELAVEEQADGTLVSFAPTRFDTRALVSSLEEAFPAGRAIFSGMEQEEAVGFLTVLDQEAFDPVDEVCDAGWWAGTARRR